MEKSKYIDFSIDKKIKTNFMPLNVLKGIFTGKKQLIAPRRIFVIIQFTVAIFLMLATFVIHRQVYYAQNRDNGYRKEYLIYHPMTGYRVLGGKSPCSGGYKGFYPPFAL